MDLEGSRGTFWGALNAIMEFVDHHGTPDISPVSYALLGPGMDLKTRAFHTVCDEADKAA